MQFPLGLMMVMVSTSVIAADEDGFISLFNGRDLSGWVNVNCAPETWSVKDGMIHCTGLPTGALRTIRQYENFILELEWRHLRSGGNSGVFIWSSPIAAPGVPFLRAIEVQVLDHGFNVPGKNEWYTTHGDVFPIHGSTMKPFGRHNGMRSFPSEERSKGTPDWNHYRIVCSNGVIRLHVNSKEVSGGEECNYRKGYVGLESEGAPIDFRNVRIKELPSSGTATELSAPMDQGWHPLFTGLDLRGWKTNSATASRWKVEGERLILQRGDPSPEAVLWTQTDFSEAEFIVDCRRPKASAGQADTVPSALVAVNQAVTLQLKLEGGAPGEYQRFFISLKGHEVTLRTGGQETRRLTFESDVPARLALGLADNGGPAEYMNFYVRENDHSERRQ
ncbi:MAG TPA: DUF1080 domain-containing protein [Candidatus Limnocylindrales bacterium]|jgi:hypothetical protein|nr:DUF1080 domain-containing protein [Candidatus Limnocylindrales bacterium]